jgi:hypothetical protein
MAVPDQTRQNSLQDPISMDKKTGMMVHTCHYKVSGKHKMKGSQSRPVWAKYESLSPKKQEQIPVLLK